MTDQTDRAADRRPFTTAEIGAIAHLYRGEVYRSTIWRTRLDTTTNWSVVTLGIAVSVSFASENASPFPLVLSGLLILFLLLLEARRYRYFNVWRARARWMETHFYAPMLVEGDLHVEDQWQDVLARDYYRPHYHIGLTRAVGRRLRRNYLWLLLFLSLAYLGKITVHPEPVARFADLPARAALGPVPGWIVLAIGVAYNAFLVLLAMATWWFDRRKHRDRTSHSHMG
ncbi:hypothetical protein OCGS_2651 [Oceaniovalibus guishaninsula JLT2003]|uniref:DUF2270 domain-containing protein n=1 Tax=Oceaniovalibus guishaninsula JLT2003 TaxID=1231392 RepID=K2I2H6_9RHOB|nr:DUF2270 domain-containing protein [Oceaniovalibus guishaninsula]EKE43060.1 hypothetical protein OCGS_2651 [Oceaniovalibus guishaninsula JLT2003]